MAGFCSAIDLTDFVSMPCHIQLNYDMCHALFMISKKSHLDFSCHIIMLTNIPTSAPFF
jgi:hypothetical protein